MKEKIIKYSKFVLLGIILIVVSIIVYNKNKEIEPNNQIVSEQIKGEPLEILEQVKKEEIETLKVDIKGEVKTPGVYKLNVKDRVSDAIEAAGGLTENADTTLINLSKNLTDEMVIIIYGKNEIEKLREDLKTTNTIIEYIERECSCPDTINDACIKEAQTDTTETLTDNKISINTATLEELQTLPSIGESKAKAIIKYREENGGFKSIEEITNVSGIGESTFENFKDYITI